MSLLAHSPWILASAGASFWLARERHRSRVGWPLLGGAACWIFGPIGLTVPAYLAFLPKTDLRRRYLELKVQEQVFQLLGGKGADAGISLEERILMVLANNPQGLHLNALAQGVGDNWRALSDPVNRLVRDRKILVRDDLYFLDAPELPPR